MKCPTCLALQARVLALETALELLSTRLAAVEARHQSLGLPQLSAQQSEERHIVWERLERQAAAIEGLQQENKGLKRLANEALASAESYKAEVETLLSVAALEAEQGGARRVRCVAGVEGAKN